MLKRTLFSSVKLFSGAYAAFQYDHTDYKTESETPEKSKDSDADHEHAPSEEHMPKPNPHKELSSKFLQQMNAHQFEKATVALRELQAKRSQYSIRTHTPDKAIEKPIVRIRFFSEYLESTKHTAMQKAVYALRDLLADPLQCSQLLKELDAQIADFEPLLGCDFSKLNPGPGILLSQQYIIPSESILSLKTIDTKNVLLYLIQKQLTKEGINTQDKLYTFLDFINEQIANNLVRQGILFDESPLSGNAILHGIYTHYLQWYLFSIAIEKGTIKLDPCINLVEVMTAMVDSKITYQVPLWSSLIDHAEEATGDDRTDYFQFFLGSPHRLNLYLLSSPLTPHLRGYLLNEWARDITTFQSFFYDSYKKEISYESLAEGFAAANEAFDGLNLQITKKMIAQFYREKQHKDVCAQTGILVENAEEKFAWAKSMDPSLRQRLLTR